MEETVVRDKAVESACVVIGLMQGGQQEVMIDRYYQVCTDRNAYTATC